MSTREAQRMPAEWEPHTCVWVEPAHNRETWPGCFEQARAQHDAFVAALSATTPVRSPRELGIPTNDSWIRDFGPIFTVGASGGLLLNDFIFNGWGDKYETRNLDNAVPRAIADKLGLPLKSHGFVLEGGSIDVNGQGTLMTTEQCLLNPNRPRKCAPGDDRAYIEQTLRDALGVHHIIWLPGGIEGDDTDGHIDDVARFINPTTVAIVSAPAGHPDHDVTQRNLAALREARDQAGQRLSILELPVPEPITYDFPADRFGPGGKEPVPASYANFLISNGQVFVPTFGQASDDAALSALDNAMLDHTITPIRSEWLVVGLGALHCLSMQQPASAGN